MHYYNRLLDMNDNLVYKVTTCKTRDCLPLLGIYEKCSYCKNGFTEFTKLIQNFSIFCEPALAFDTNMCSM